MSQIDGEQSGASKEAEDEQSLERNGASQKIPNGPGEPEEQQAKPGFLKKVKTAIGLDVPMVVIMIKYDDITLALSYPRAERSIGEDWRRPLPLRREL